MANAWSGEVGIVIDGAPRVMKLTLGALAELEASMAADSLVALVERFETGAFTTRDVLALIVAGLRGGGWRGDASDCTLAMPARSTASGSDTTKIGAKYIQNSHPGSLRDRWIGVFEVMSDMGFLLGTGVVRRKTRHDLRLDARGP